MASVGLLGFSKDSHILRGSIRAPSPFNVRSNHARHDMLKLSTENIKRRDILLKPIRRQRAISLKYEHSPNPTSSCALTASDREKSRGLTNAGMCNFHSRNIAIIYKGLVDEFNVLVCYRLSSQSTPQNPGVSMD